MIHNCICSQYSLKAPHPPKDKNRTERPRPVEPLSPRSQGFALGGRYQLGWLALNSQMPAGGSRAGLAIDVQLSANKVLKTSVPLPREGREEDT